MRDVYTENVLLQCGDPGIPWARCPLDRPGPWGPPGWGRELAGTVLAELTQLTTES